MQYRPPRNADTCASAAESTGALAPDLTVTEGLVRVSPNGLSSSAGHMIP
ncbi:MAG: hypothetical protein QOF66_4117, partial [Mycobacterium sp.]|nr:hypothetical protein [Mycobacterium sp.]